MKQILLSLVILFSIFTFTSCKEDNHLDWKYINQQWYNQQKQIAAESDEWHITDSGLLYKVINVGIGDNNYVGRPSDKSRAVFYCTGVLMNGETFQTTAVLGTNYGETVSTWVSGVQEGLKMMKQNAKYEFVMPYELGYGEEGGTSIPPYTTLKFEIELIDFWTE